MDIWNNVLTPDIRVALLLFFGILVFIGSYNFLSGIKNRRERAKKVQRDYGKNLSVKKLSKDMDRIYQVMGGNIDDITFCDFKMEDFLKHFDHTKSKLGEQYFYYCLRNTFENFAPLKEMQQERWKMAQYPKKVQSYQEDFLSLGKGNYEIWNLIHEGVHVPSELVIPVYLMSFTLIYILILFFFLRVQAIFPILLLLMVNGWIHKQLSDVKSGNLINLLYLRLMIAVAKDVTKHEDEFFQEQKEELRDLVAKVTPLKRALGTFSMPGSFSADMQFMEIYIDVLTMSMGRKLVRSQKYISKFQKELERIYLLLGKMDMDCALVSFSHGNAVTQVQWGAERLEAEEMNSPLLFDKSVPNSFSLQEGSILLTGSNASGKSTFLRAVGINELLALTVGLAFAKEWITDCYQITTAIDLHDSLEKGVSYFMAEAMAIGRMIQSKKRQLLLLDEIFRGTNTIDRISAATYTLKYLAKRNFVIVATHDIELTELLKEDYRNYHFEEDIFEDDIHFDYQLKVGPTNSKNAIAILKMQDYPKDIIEDALALAKKLEEKG